MIESNRITYVFYHAVSVQCLSLHEVQLKQLKNSVDDKHSQQTDLLTNLERYKHTVDGAENGSAENFNSYFLRKYLM